LKRPGIWIAIGQIGHEVNTTERHGNDAQLTG
jgi:hypothetical protein